MKKIVVIGFLMLMIGVSAATEISFSPADWNIQNWCLVATDIIVDTSNNNIAATDIVIESSLEYVDFVPSKNIFPYFFSPQTGENTIHIIWFVSDPQNTVKWSGSVGRIFFRQKHPTDTDGAIKLYFAWKGETYDTNLSILWGIDVLEKVSNWYYRFDAVWSCEYSGGYGIVWWFSHTSPEESLNTTIKAIQQQQWINRFLSWKMLILYSFLLIILIIIFIYITQRKEWKKK
ncbi:MAG: hypothetical protein ACD_80C00142G0022 [uncultured bacterium (gcode 4)]|uniref:Uncharacterized protein n=1 Tax=uncultured bacterium (gcode 4) TaxID=1234023 RepID=K1X4C8_9BACT|nr:MAG: hypothetical protein ACD_80C00142G0022 [uncultured bacterium (gcode 4)]